ncbi:hypothetical protein CBR_g22371 [Chara braunii]|uniref:CP12 domain-containing protein n=1 Tax=Chara braunii TaxID=69332 RepID=A0A388JUT5_CHABU|nr:hypothetical protein CBR_g22371 [Chara braunii]|eukprot:GBG61574.1 hypothetical protein CBR_g22371 [Chara braunii]
MAAATALVAPSPSGSNSFRSAAVDGHVASCSPRVMSSSFHVIGSDLRRPRIISPAQRRSPFTVFSASSDLQNLEEKVEESIKQAQETCESGTDGECKAAWDEVEELSAELSHKTIRVKQAKGDPLEAYCVDNPEVDECKVYDD